MDENGTDIGINQTHLDEVHSGKALLALLDTDVNWLTVTAEEKKNLSRLAISKGSVLNMVSNTPTITHCEYTVVSVVLLYQ